MPANDGHKPRPNPLPNPSKSLPSSASTYLNAKEIYNEHHAKDAYQPESAGFSSGNNTFHNFRPWGVYS